MRTSRERGKLPEPILHSDWRYSGRVCSPIKYMIIFRLAARGRQIRPRVNALESCLGYAIGQWAMNNGHIHLCGYNIYAHLIWLLIRIRPVAARKVPKKLLASDGDFVVSEKKQSDYDFISPKFVFLFCLPSSLVPRHDTTDHIVAPFVSAFEEQLGLFVAAACSGNSHFNKTNEMSLALAHKQIIHWHGWSKNRSIIKELMV